MQQNWDLEMFLDAKTSAVSDIIVNFYKSKIYLNLPIWTKFQPITRAENHCRRSRNANFDDPTSSLSKSDCTCTCTPTWCVSDSLEKKKLFPLLLLSILLFLPALISSSWMQQVHACVLCSIIRYFRKYESRSTQGWVMENGYCKKYLSL